MQAEKLRLQKLHLEAQREQARIKQEKEDQEEQDRLYRLQIEREETERIRIEELERMEIERIKLLRIQEEEEIERLRWIKAAQQEAERIRAERQVIEEAEKLKKTQAAKDAESERQRLLQFAVEEAQKLLDRLQNIEAEEEDRIRYKTSYEYTSRVKYGDHHDILANLERTVEESKGDDLPDPSKGFTELYQLGLTESELDQQCEDLFKETPIKFKPRKDNEMDEMIDFFIKSHEITIPILWIKDSLYLIGSSRLNVQLKNDQLILKVGGGYEKFDEYIPKHLLYFQRMLVVYMIKSGESLEWVIDALLHGKRIRNIFDKSELTQKRSTSRGSVHSSGGYRRTMHSPIRERSYMDVSSYVRKTTPNRDDIKRALKSGSSPYSYASDLTRNSETRSALSAKRRRTIHQITRTTNKYQDGSSWRDTGAFDEHSPMADYKKRKNQILASLHDINTKLHNHGANAQFPVPGQDESDMEKHFEQIQSSAIHD